MYGAAYVGTTSKKKKKNHVLSELCVCKIMGGTSITQ